MGSTDEGRVGSQGRLVIPAELRAELAAEEGTVDTAHVDASGALVLRTRDQALRELQRLWAEVERDGSPVDELIAGRRRAAAEE